MSRTQSISFVELYKKRALRGKFVALMDSGMVVGAGTTPELALARARKKGYNDPILTVVPSTADAFLVL